MENKSLIKLNDVTVKFKEHLVLDKVCMEFESGKIYGIIGRNGSGKTVLLKCVCGLMDTTDGTVSVNGKIVGKDVDFPENIGFIIENPGFLPHYSGFKNLKYLASIRGTITDDDIRRCIRTVGLDPDDKKSVKHYSLGMKQKIYLAGAFMSNAQNIILDEPFNAIDPESTSVIKKILLDLKDTGKMILFSVHNLDLVSNFCDKIIFIDNRHSIFECNNPQNFYVLEKIY